MACSTRVDTQKNECQKEKSTSQFESCEVNFEYHGQQSWTSQNEHTVDDSWLATITDQKKLLNTKPSLLLK